MTLAFLDDSDDAFGWSAIESGFEDNDDLDFGEDSDELLSFSDDEDEELELDDLEDFDLGFDAGFDDGDDSELSLAQFVDDLTELLPDE